MANDARFPLLALLGSALMFAGWVLAIVPAFRHLQNVAIVVIVAVIGFALVLIPAGMDMMGAASGEKRSLGTIVVSTIPAALLFLITVFALPLETVYRVLAILAELAGMALYLAAWWHAAHAASVS